MMNKYIPTIFLCNMLSICKKAYIFSLIILMYVFEFLDEIQKTDLYVYGATPETIRKVAILTQKKIIEENAFVCFRSIILSFVLAIFVLFWFLLFSRQDTLKNESKNINIKFNNLKNEYKIPKWIKCKIHRTRTFSQHLNLYISLNDLINISKKRTKFILFHETLHIITLDSFFSTVEKIFSIMLAFVITIYVTEKIVEALSLQENTLYYLVLRQH